MTRKIATFTITERKHLAIKQHRDKNAKRRPFRGGARAGERDPKAEKYRFQKLNGKN